MTSNIISALAEITLQSSLLIAAALLLRSIFGAKTDKRLRYYIWLPVLLRLVLPFSVRSSVSVMNLFTPAAENAVLNTPTAGAEALLTASASQSLSQTAAQPFTWRSVILGVWLLGAAVIALITLCGNIRFAARLKKGREEENIEIMAALCEKMGIRKMPRVYASDMCESPCAVGVLRPVIYLPAWADSSPGQLDYILMHELTHIKRTDNALAMLFSLCCAVYWFNPLVWIMAYSARADREFACDAWVTRGMNTAEKTSYGMALVSALQQQSACRRRAYAAGFADGKKEMLERIKSIKSGRPAAKYAAVCVCTAMAAALLTFGTSANAAESLPKEVLDSEAPRSAYVSSHSFESSTSIMFGTFKLSDSKSLECLNKSLTPDEGWTECSVEKSISEAGEGSEHFYITIPEEGNWSKGGTYEVLKGDSCGYVYSRSFYPEIPYDVPKRSCMRMSDEAYSSFTEMLEELKETSEIY